MAEPIIVAKTEHRTKNDKGQRFGHLGYVQRRTTDKIARYGGKRFASWARLTVDGIETGCAERFETYDHEAEALAHAKYAASVTP